MLLLCPNFCNVDNFHLPRKPQAAYLGPHGYQTARLCERLPFKNRQQRWGGGHGRGQAQINGVLFQNWKARRRIKGSGPEV